MDKVKNASKPANNNLNSIPQGNKFKSKGPMAKGGSFSGGGASVYRPSPRKPHGKQTFTKTMEDIRKERALQFQERQAARAQKQKELQEQREKVKKEKEEKIRQYKKKRLEKTKVISKRTQRGQPLMKDRMQFLLKQIQEMKKTSS